MSMNLNKLFKNIKLNYILILVIILLIFFLYRGCCASINYRDTTNTVKDSVIYVKGKSDTVYFAKTKVITKLLPSKVDTVIDTVEGKPTVTKHYTSNLDDSLLTAKLITVIEAGDLKYTDFTYTPKFPKYITRVDTVKEYYTNTVTKDKASLYAGFIVGGSANSFVLAPGISLKVKKLIISTNYNLIDKQVLIGVNTKIVNPFAKSK